jgi:hypothetical protein
VKTGERICTTNCHECLVTRVRCRLAG